MGNCVNDRKYLNPVCAVMWEQQKYRLDKHWLVLPTGLIPCNHRTGGPCAHLFFVVE